MGVRLDGKTAVVTGASRGIGAAIARELKAAGARVVGTRTGADAGSGTGDHCDEWIAADFGDAGHIRECADRVRSIEPHILVNNAGTNKNAPFTEVTPADFLFLHQVNVFAPFMMCQAAVPAMAKRRWGRIVNVSSIFGKVSKAHRASYSACKFALDGMTVALAAEHSANGVLANCVAPGFIDTDLTRRMLGDAGIAQVLAGVPIGRLGKVEEIARLVAWLASDENSFVTGQNIAIDGGFTRV